MSDLVQKVFSLFAAIPRLQRKIKVIIIIIVVFFYMSFNKTHIQCAGATLDDDKLSKHAGLEYV